jgi:hypothetical protein
MAGVFVAASSQRLTASSYPITGYPFTWGAWIKPTSTSAQVILSLCSSSINGANLYSLNNGAGFIIRAVDGAGQAVSGAIGTITANSWHYVVARYISATNRRIAVLQPDGLIAHGQNTTSKAPSASNQLGLGCQADSVPDSFFDGAIAEFWMADYDIQADGAQLQDRLVRQLAYGGPFSVPYIVEYRAMRSGPLVETSNESFQGKFTRRTWVNTNSVTTGPHPPLPYWYAKPGQTKRLLRVG